MEVDPALPDNAWAAKYFAIAIGAVMVLSMSLHLGSHIFFKLNDSASSGWVYSLLRIKR